MKAIYRIEESPGESVKYAQQHLANERTYLAWIRTAISITGVGFLTTSLHFTTKMSSNVYMNSLVIILGIFACVIGVITSVLSTIQYTRKRKEIADGIFTASNQSIIFVSTLFFLLVFMIFMYLSFILLVKS